MGLGTKIKGAFSGDKDHHSSHGKKAPGAYPESVATPRTTTTDAWQQPNINKPLPETQDGSTIDDAKFGHYSLANDKDWTKPQQRDDDFNVAPETQTTGFPENRLSKDNDRQAPYWGDVGTAKTSGHGTMAHDAMVQDTMAREQQDMSQYQDREQDMSRYQDREAGMFPNERGINEQTRAPVMTDARNYNSNVDQRQFSNDAGAMRDERVNQNYDKTFPMADAAGRDQHGAYRNTELPAQPVPDRLDDPFVNSPTGGQFAPNQTTMGRGVPDYNIGAQPRDAVFMEREQLSPVGGSEHGSAGLANPSSVDHYGPGHSGAKVFHRCQHCGNDNDISKYFNKDVVYRLS